MRDYITDMTNGYCKLRFGGYVASDSVDIVYGKPLLLNTILTTAVEVNAKDTSNNNYLIFHVNLLNLNIGKSTTLII